jgi:putative endonuclease
MMARNEGPLDGVERGRERGRRGEELAVAWLRERGFEIVERNLRRRQCGEVDLLARRGGELHVIEVKTGAAPPAELMQRVDERKLRLLLGTLARSGWLEAGPEGAPCLVDLLLVQLGEGGPRIELVEDVCPPELRWRGGPDLLRCHD